MRYEDSLGVGDSLDWHRYAKLRGSDDATSFASVLPLVAMPGRLAPVRNFSLETSAAAANDFGDEQYGGCTLVSYLMPLN